MTIQGVKAETKFVGKDNFEVRKDGFGRMSDEDVHKYKLARSDRYQDYADGIRMDAIELRLDALEV